jgi:hypothetical protein
MLLKEGLLRFLSFLPKFHAYGLKITPRSGLNCAPSSDGTKAGSHSNKPKTVLHPLQGPGQNSHFDILLKYEILHPSQSSWNTPLLPVQKIGIEDFRSVP